jgi:CreA protein
METAMTRIFASLAAMILLTAPLRAEPVGEVDTAFKLLGANHKIVVEAFDDPKIDGVTCFLSMAKKGGISGSLGLAEDPSDASIACRQVGPIRFREAIESDEEGERVFHARRSVLFKKLQVVRFFDPRRNTLIYLAYSDRLIDGSPKNAISAVAMMPWGDRPPGKALVD